MINLDQSLLIQFVLFVTFMLLLNQILFKPFLRLLERRHARIYGTKEEAEQLRQEAERLMGTFEEEMKRRSEEAFKERVSMREQAKREAQVLLEDVQTKAQEEISRAKGVVLPVVENLASRRFVGLLTRRQALAARARLLAEWEMEGT